MTKSEINSYLIKHDDGTMSSPLAIITLDSGKVIEGSIRKGSNKWFFSEGRYYVNIGYKEKYYFSAEEVVSIHVVDLLNTPLVVLEDKDD